MVRYKIEERDADGNRVAEYESVTSAAEIRGINKGTRTYSICHEGHIVKKTQTAFYKKSKNQEDNCQRCRYRERYNIGGYAIYGCGYNLHIGKMRGCKIEDCERWRENA